MLKKSWNFAGDPGCSPWEVRVSRLSVACSEAGLPQLKGILLCSEISIISIVVLIKLCKYVIISILSPPPLEVREDVYSASSLL